MTGLPQAVSLGTPLTLASSWLPRFQPLPMPATSCAAVPVIGPVVAVGVGVGVGRGVCVGLGVGDVVGVLVGVTGLPVHATPLSVKAVGAGLDPAHVPLKPNDAVPLVAMFP